MNFNKITDNYVVSDQINIDDISKIKDAGFRTIICHRPDGEAEDQPPHELIEKAARSLDLQFVYQPISPGQFNNQLFEDFQIVCDSSPAPIFAFCRTGTRSCTVWALSQKGKLSDAEILSKTKNAGYDLSQLFV
jgi:uncharacterized protein (TIGR01244 family)